MSTTPQIPPSVLDKARELKNAAAVVLSPPSATFNPPGGGPARTRGATSDVNWRANRAYWDTYPDADEKVAAGDKAGADAWLRIKAAVGAGLYATTLAQPTASWDPAKPTWPLLSPPAQWGAGDAFEAKRPWYGPQTRRHTGVDLGCDAGVPLLAPEAGTIVAPESGWEVRDGKGVVATVMQTNSGLTLLLGGVRPGSAMVKAGEQVSAGQQLAVIGNYPGGSSMLHFTAYDALLTEKEVNARKSWPVNGPRPANLIDPSGYLEAAATNPRYVLVGAFESGTGPGLVVNEVGAGELAEGVPPVPAKKPTAPPAGDVVAVNGRTGAAPCLGECNAEDAQAWQAALLMYRSAAETQKKLAEARVAKGKKWSPLASEGLKNLAVVDQFIAQMNALPGGVPVDSAAIANFVGEHVDACRTCVDAGKALGQFAKPPPPASGGLGLVALVGAAVVTTVVVVAVVRS